MGDDLTLAIIPQQCSFRTDPGAAHVMQVGQNLQNKAGDIKDKVRPCLRALAAMHGQRACASSTERGMDCAKFRPLIRLG